MEEVSAGRMIIKGGMDNNLKKTNNNFYKGAEWKSILFSKKIIVVK